MKAILRLLRVNPAHEMGLHSAAIRKDRWIAKRNARVAQLCAEMDKPVPSALQA